MIYDTDNPYGYSSCYYNPELDLSLPLQWETVSTSDSDLYARIASEVD